MTERSVTHSTFVIERTLAAPPERVYEAFSSPEAKRRWFGGPDEWGASDHVLDFTVGGKEHVSGGPPGGPVHSYDAVIMDIVPGHRIVTAYEMHLDDTRISVSLGTTQIEPDGDGTRLTYTEQGAFLDGYDDAGAREEGTQGLFDALARSLETAEAPSA